MVISHNLPSMNAYRAYTSMEVGRTKSAEKLSSGYKINRAADDAAGLTISEKMRSLIRGLNQGSDNIQDGISLMQIADGALSEVHGMLHRMTELAVKASNETNTAAEREAMQREVTSIVDEVDRIGASTSFNTMLIFDRATIEGQVGTLTSLVPSPSAENSKMNEAYLGPDGKYYPAATIDFSNITADNVELLNGGNFKFVCPYGCGETFNITFSTGDVPSSRTDSGNFHDYVINIKGATSGTDVVDRIYSYVSAHATTNNGLSTRVGGAGVSHSSALVRTGDVLTVLADTPEDTAAAAIAYGQSLNGTRGQVDCSGISRQLSPEPVLSFNIQCSNIKSDCFTIRTRMMNAEYIGIDKVDLSTVEGARDALAKIEDAVAFISADRSEYGAYVNRLESAYANNTNKAENTQAAESLLRDTDMAKTMVEYTKSNILAQVGTAMMAQANQSTQSVLSLLQ